MDYLLHNIIMDNIISYFIVINCLTILIASFFDFKNKENNSKEDKCKINYINIFKNTVIILWVLLLTYILVFILIKYNLYAIFPCLYYFSHSWGIIKIRSKNIGELSYENEMKYIALTSLYLMFFSNDAANIYQNTPLNISNLIKEYILVAFLITKLIIFVFIFIINLSILIYNFKKMFNKILKKSKKTIKEIINKNFDINYYYMHFSKDGKKRKMLFIDIPLFVIFCPILIICNIILPVIIYFTKYIIKKVQIIGNITNYYIDNSSKIILKIIKISTIISLVIVYGIIIYNPETISIQTKDFYSLIIAVILIPLIYDSIKR